MKKETDTFTNKNPPHTWHGIDFHHPIHSLQNSHPALFVACLLALYAMYIFIFATLSKIIGGHA